MKYARLLVLGVALGAGLLAARMVMSNRTPDSVPVAEKPAQSDTVKVLAAAHDINLGDKLSPDDLAWTDWPRAALPSDAMTKTDQPDAAEIFIGQIAKAPIYEGEPIRKQRLINTDKGFMASILPKGKRAIAVGVEAETMAGGFILPGDKIDVILVRENEGRSVTSETILENVRVLAIDTTTAGEQDEKSLDPKRTATLELNIEQAEIVAQAQQLGTISLALRSAQDSADDESEPIRRRGGVSFVKYGVSSQANTQ